MNNTKYDIAIHTTTTSYGSDPRKWDKRRLKRFLRLWLRFDDVTVISVGKYKPKKRFDEDYFKNGLTMVADRLFVSDLKDIRKFK